MQGFRRTFEVVFALGLLAGCSSAPVARAPTPHSSPQAVQTAPHLEPQAHPNAEHLRAELRLATEYLREALAEGAGQLAPEEVARAQRSLARAKAATSFAEKEDLAQTAAFDAKAARNLTIERKTIRDVKVVSPKRDESASPLWLWALIGVGLFATAGFAFTVVRWVYHRPPAALTPAKRLHAA